MIDFEDLYFYNLKIFGDVFESVIAAVFLDSKSLERTQEVLFKLLDPYIIIYGDLNEISEHPRT
jgi:dsRNA-specific ribonuclease